MQARTRARWATLGAAAIAVGCGSEAGDGANGSATTTGTGGGGTTSTGSGGSTSSGGGGGATSTGGGGTGGVSNELVTLASFHYEGAFRIPAGDFGESSANYAAGPIALNPAHHSLYLVGHAQQHPLAEFSIPSLVASTVLADLAMAAPPLQGFVTILDDATGGNPQDMNSIGGMLWLQGPNGPELVVNAYEYYDAPADDTHTTLVVRDADDVAGSTKAGWFELGGGAHTSGWMSAIPPQHQAALGGAFLSGHSSGIPIIGRASVGPSAFVFDPTSMLGDAAPGQVATKAVLDFSLATPLADDLSNDSGTNDLWTHLSRAAYGFIPPGTRTYVTIGHSGGHATGVCYKCVPAGASEACGGYCANDVADYSDYYWLWDVDELAAVASGAKQPHEVAPYEHGPFPSQFPKGKVGGGAYDEASGLLYLAILGADDQQGTYAVPPLVVAYSIH